jgi:uncharacterized membrane protein (UPF0127 family)
MKKSTCIAIFSLTLLFIGGIFILKALMIAPGHPPERPEAGSGVEAVTKSEPRVLELATLLPNIEYADTPSLRARGLSGRSALPEDAGLLFSFEENDKHGIWMKDMRFPIDIIWLNEAGTIVGLTKDAEPESFPEVFYPESDARYVLETNVGFVAKHHLKLGDRLKLPQR